MALDHALHLVSQCTASETVRCFQEIGAKHGFWWWLQHRWYARPKATQVFQIAIPTIITGAAFLIAWSQREIAANKYRMDLYDKRSPAIMKAAENAKKILKPPFHISTIIYDEVLFINKCISQLEETFSLFSSVSLKKTHALQVEFNEKFDIVKEKEGQILSLNAKLVDLSKKRDMEFHTLQNPKLAAARSLSIEAARINHANLEKEINELSHDIENKENDLFLYKDFFYRSYNDLCESLIDINEERNKLWYIPHNPYNESKIDQLLRGFIK